MSYDTVWADMSGTYLGEGDLDGKFVPISECDKAILAKKLNMDMVEDKDEDFYQDIAPDYYTERLEATHFLIYTRIPEGLRMTLIAISGLGGISVVC